MAAQRTYFEQKVQKICHAKCARTFKNYDFIDESRSCWSVTLLKNADITHLNLIEYDKYSQPDSDSFSEIHEIENLLENCNRYYLHELNNHIMKNSIEPLSIMFINIDSVTSNFDLFSTEITSTNDKLSVITLAENNLDECNKNLFTIRGYQSVYQSKITGKHKGSGLAIYLKNVFLHTTKDELSQCTSHLELLFISIYNTDNPLTIGVIYIDLPMVIIANS